ncbi:TerB family tellurite resistance protein [Maritimibacter sp. DP1N21-5]|uniref:tellurite resistance TerB family protein n=1 Tax=Maritimibacter sp. DP1N21-5 TaxID=2836867 RepID=UPI001C439CD2|nr:TerB family tellurite resistance protein [Maritimibacter sp. DP1N21-5]MBV7410268.1 TerB family tellurite resistance protein [Maritimibacter sp. DP1N21-5]
MFDRILNSLFGSEPQELPDTDARLALAALLVRIAKSDGVYESGEAETIRDILAGRYGLSYEDSRELLVEAEEMETHAPDTVRFTEAIKAAVPYDQRSDIVYAAWEVVMADGQRADEEDALMRMIAKFLGVSDRDSNIARQKAQR